jgi:hypothetical protein
MAGMVRRCPDRADLVLFRQDAQQGFAQQPILNQQENCGYRSRKF